MLYLDRNNNGVGIVRNKRSVILNLNFLLEIFIKANNYLIHVPGFSKKTLLGEVAKVPR